MTVLPAILCALLFPVVVLAADWEKIEAVVLPGNTSGLDGDSIPIEIEGGRVTINLYFVDAAEAKGGSKDRIAEQAAHWQIDAAAVEVKGDAAREKVRELLDAKSFSVHTRRSKINAFGGGERWYGMIELADGTLLSEQLVKAGLARVKGKTITLFDGRSASEFAGHLEALANGGAMGAEKAETAPSPATTDLPTSRTTTAPTIVYKQDGELVKVGTLPKGREMKVLGVERFLSVEIEVEGREPITGLVRESELE